MVDKSPATIARNSLAAMSLVVASIFSTAPVATEGRHVADESLRLAALLSPANSTAQIFAGSIYYGVDQTKVYGRQQIIPFFFGPQGVVNAVDAHHSDPNVAIFSSGWGAGQTSSALAIMAAKQDPAMNNLKVVVLDNDTNRAGGGFWTTYWMFAPLLFTSAAPTPANTNVPVVDTAYEYNINSDAPTYPINLLADLNSLIAYAYDYGGEQRAHMPPAAMVPVAPGDQHYHYIVAPNGSVTQKIPVSGNITYVTFQTNGLPLVQPLRLIPFIGNALANALQPELTKIVNGGYQDSSPIPKDPTVTRPVGLLPAAAKAPVGTSNSSNRVAPVAATSHLAASAPNRTTKTLDESPRQIAQATSPVQHLKPQQQPVSRSAAKTTTEATQHSR